MKAVWSWLCIVVVGTQFGQGCLPMGEDPDPVPPGRPEMPKMPGTSEPKSSCSVADMFEDYDADLKDDAYGQKDPEPDPAMHPPTFTEAPPPLDPCDEEVRRRWKSSDEDAVEKATAAGSLSCQKMCVCTNQKCYDNRKYDGTPVAFFPVFREGMSEMLMVLTKGKLVSVDGKELPDADDFIDKGTRKHYKFSQNKYLEIQSVDCGACHLPDEVKHC